MEIKTRKIIKKEKKSSNIRIRKSLNKYSELDYDEYTSDKDHKDVITVIEYGGYKKDKLLGPGVMYFVDSSKKIDIFLGNFDNHFLSDEGTVFSNNLMIYDGGILKGQKHGFGKERFYLNLKNYSEFSSDYEKRNSNYLEYKGFYKQGKRHGKGTLSFKGNHEHLQSYFEEQKNENQMEMINLGMFNSDIEGEIPHDIPLIQKHIDPKYDVSIIFNKLPMNNLDTEKGIHQNQVVQSKSSTFESKHYISELQFLIL
jgi:hypothetical protein